jgi:hypothetical protein
MYSSFQDLKFFSFQKLKEKIRKQDLWIKLAKLIDQPSSPFLIGNMTVPKYPLEDLVLLNFGAHY